jgi:hypothetical protein
MINSWSLLYDELKMSKNFETTYESFQKDFCVAAQIRTSHSIIMGRMMVLV